MHAYHWQQSWCGGLGAGGEELQDKREDTHEVYMQNVIQRMHAYHWQQSWCGGLGLGGEKLQDKKEDINEASILVYAGCNRNTSRETVIFYHT